MKASTGSEQLNQFLLSAGWENAQRQAINADASGRKYIRLTQVDQNSSAILMDARDESKESLVAFIQMTKFLREQGLSAPTIYHAEPGRQLLLIEDLGDDLFSRILSLQPTREQELYGEAIAVIHQIHKQNQNINLQHFGPSQMAQAVDLVFIYYCHRGEHALGAQEQEVIEDFRELLASLGSFNFVALRDYHSENLIWLPTRSGISRVGLLDYQDAVLSHMTYDLVSLTRDARRDVSPALARHVTEEFANIRGENASDITAQAAVISVQRNLRIMGVFARLALTKNKTQYLDLMPRIWAYLCEDMKHPIMMPMANKLQNLIPKPSESHLKWLMYDGK